MDQAQAMTPDRRKAEALHMFQQRYLTLREACEQYGVPEDEIVPERRRRH